MPNPGARADVHRFFDDRRGVDSRTRVVPAGRHGKAGARSRLVSSERRGTYRSEVLRVTAATATRTRVTATASATVVGWASPRVTAPRNASTSATRGSIAGTLGTSVGI